MSTPKGIPRWSADCSWTAVDSVGTSAALLRYLRDGRASGARLRDVVRHAPISRRQRLRTAQSRVWRPPVSGHETPRYGSVATHPFNNAAAGGVPSIDRSFNSKSDSARLPGTAACVPTLSPSQRALSAARGNTILVPARTATRMVALSGTARSVSMPANQSLRQAATATAGTPQRSCSSPISTTRTAQMIDRFPHPPHVYAGAENSPVKKPAWALFPPRLADLRSSSGTTWVVSESLPEHTSAWEWTRTIQPSSPHLQSQLEHETGVISETAIAPHPEDQSCREARDAEAHRVADNRAASRMTCSSRYFSAASQAQPTETVNCSLPHCGSDLQVDGLRKRCPAKATSNGDQHGIRPVAPGIAVRKLPTYTGTSSDHPYPAHTSVGAAIHLQGIPASTRNESVRPTTPLVTVRSWGSLCHHKLARQLARDAGKSQNPHSIDGPRPLAAHAGLHITQLDGDPSPRPELQRNSSQTPATPPSPVASPTHHPSNFTLQPPPTVQSASSVCIQDFHTLNHQEQDEHFRHMHRSKGTWRTRMQRTRCWRCALHDSKAKGWAKIQALMEWTCFCRFKAYEEDADSDIELRPSRGFGASDWMPHLGTNG